MTFKLKKISEAGDLGTRERVLRSAVRLFAENGYAATSVREIVESAGVTKPVLYYHFKSKDGLYQAVWEEAYQTLARALANGLKCPGNTLERLNHLFGVVMDLAANNKNVAKLMSITMFGPKQAAAQKQNSNCIEATLEAIKTIYREGLARGEVRNEDPGLVAGLLGSLLSQAIVSQLAFPQNQVPLASPDDMLRLVFRGLEERNGQE